MESHSPGELPTKWPSGWNIALIGASTLQGKEIRAVLEESGLPRRRVALIDTEDAQGQLTELDGEPTVIQPLAADTFQGVDLAIFASSAAFTAQHWRRAAESGSRVIDLSGALDDHPDAAFSAPLLSPIDEKDASQRIYGPRGIAISPDPAALAIAGMLSLLSRHVKVVRAAATLLASISGQGQEGVEELHRQTVNILSFQELPKTVFDAQVAFNMLSRYGDQSRAVLHDARQRIVSNIKSLSDGFIQPAIQLLQAPVFHGYSFSCWLELERPLTEMEVGQILNQKPFSMRPDAEPQPDSISAAGQDEFIVGAVQRDPPDGTGYWIWCTFDHLRIAALNALRIAEQMIANSPTLEPEERLDAAAAHRNHV